MRLLLFVWLPLALAQGGYKQTAGVGQVCAQYFTAKTLTVWDDFCSNACNDPYPVPVYDYTGLPCQQCPWYVDGGCTKTGGYYDAAQGGYVSQYSCDSGCVALASCGTVANGYWNALGSCTFACNAGYTVSGSGCAPSACPAGQYNNGAGCVACGPCYAGYYLSGCGNGPGQCLPCSNT